MTDTILTFQPVEHSTALRCVASNGVCLGELYQEVDGFFVYVQPTGNGGYLSEQILMELALKLSDLNSDWRDQLVRDLRTKPSPLSQSEPDDPFTNSRTGGPL